MCPQIPSAQFWEMVGIWNSTCHTCHTECLSATNSALPTRVIDVGETGEGPTLIVSEGRLGQWVALSHCWGDIQLVKSTSASLPGLSRRLCLSELPILFRDAIAVTRQLGYRYLWIDSLCILQDSPQDWRNESANMGYIYGNSALTIAAEGCKDSQTGLFDCANDGRASYLAGQVMTPISFSNGQNPLSGHIFCGNREMARSKFRGPLSTRAWTLQENILSTRILRFSRSKVWWQCREMQQNEGIPRGNGRISSNQWTSFTIKPTKFSERAALQSVGNVTLDPLWQWREIVNDFTSRHITFSKDKFPAISAMARHFARETGQKYKAGLWSNDMHRGLLWSSMAPGATKADQYLAPSWSWASVDFEKMYFSGPIPDGLEFVYQNGLYYHRLGEHIADIVEVSVENVDDDEFGQVISGKMVIEAPCQTICSCDVPPSFFDCYVQGNSRDISYGCSLSVEAIRDCNAKVIAGLKCVEATTTIHEELLYLHVASHGDPSWNRVALALLLKGVEGNNNSIFQRVGLGMLREPVRTDSLWPTRRVTIV
jgi:hypothetical protein